MGKIIAVDFDGTIAKVNPENKFAIGDEVPGAIDTLKQLRKAGHKLILWTVRDGQLLDDARIWLVSDPRNFLFDAVNDCPWHISTSPKVFANVYVDDRAGWPMVYPWTDKWESYVDWDYVAAWFQDQGYL